MDEELISGRDFVILGIQSIDDDAGNIKNITYEIAKNNRVLVIHLPVDRISAIRHKNDAAIRKKLDVVNGLKEPLEKVGENLWSYYPTVTIESINWIKIPFVFDFFNRRNSKRFAKEINKALQIVGFKNVILINDNDFYRSFYLKEYLPNHLYIYYMRDFFTYMAYWKLHGKRLEHRLISKADIALSNSLYLTDYCKKFNPHSFFVGQGCDLNLFNEQEIENIPEDIKNIPKPIIGFIGALVTTRLDIGIIEYIAQKRNQWSIVLVGPEDEVFKKSALHRLSNVYFLGRKPIKEAPAYIDQFDVCINPQTVNPMTIGNYPLKIDEYLAMGKPVVATETMAMEMFREYIHLANKKEEHVRKIEIALKEAKNEDLRKRRRNFATSHSWENNVKQIYQAIKIVEKPHLI